jgi:hypothetical protein
MSRSIVAFLTIKMASLIALCCFCILLLFWFCVDSLLYQYEILLHQLTVILLKYSNTVFYTVPKCFFQPWKCIGNRENGGYQISQSIKCWEEWGVMAKVRQLEEKYTDLLPAKASHERGRRSFLLLCVERFNGNMLETLGAPLYQVASVW